MQGRVHEVKKHQVKHLKLPSHRSIDGTTSYLFVVKTGVM